MCLNRKVILMEESMLINTNSKGALALEVLVQEGPSALVSKGRLYLNGA